MEEPLKQPVTIQSSAVSTGKKRVLKLSWKRTLDISVVVLIIVALSLGIGKLLRPSFASTLRSYTVSQSQPLFIVSFYSDAEIQQNNNIAYLVSASTPGNERSIWVTAASPLGSCHGSTPNSFQFKEFNQNSVTGCYASDKLTYVGDVHTNGQNYQINLVSQKSIGVSDVITIFNSVYVQ